jgi:hypothetical protein
MMNDDMHVVLNRRMRQGQHANESQMLDLGSGVSQNCHGMLHRDSRIQEKR